MLNRNLLYIIFIISISIINSNCVSVGIETPQTTKAQNVIFKPPSYFSELVQPYLDAAWKNDANGNTISFLSECDSATDPTHETIRDGIIAGLRNSNILSNDYIPLSKRNALKSVVTGSVDGVKTKLEIVVLKKNNCIYILTYVGLQEKFNDDLDAFAEFLKEFKVP
ncbi:MAG: hypothetical protein KDD58_13655 [Bdellovibrionales bacterium]|nr:hypothetical protein [Bdellovibrionales bacterium]